MSRKLHSAALCALVLLSGACDAAERVTCRDLVRVADLPPVLDEASGIALSRRDDSIIWTHNDSEGIATLYALARDGSLLGEVSMPDAGRQYDWEDIAAGPCHAGHCLYIADIGDNLHDRDDRAILRITDPGLEPEAEPRVERLPVQYPDGPVDAEALFVMPDTSIYIVTKGRRGAAALFRYPPPLRPDERVTLEQVQQLGDGGEQLPDLITAADASPDGEHVTIRTYREVTLYRFDGDTLVSLGAADVTSLGEPQGEALTFLGGDTLLLATETGPARAQPFLARVRCSGS